VEKKVRQNSKYRKNDKSKTKNVQSSGEVATNLKTLSQLIGALFWCDSSAKI